MRTFDDLIILDHDSSKPCKVIGVIDGKPRAAGWLMPQLKDSRQQPKSLTFRLLEDRLDTKSQVCHTEGTFGYLWVNPAVLGKGP